MSDLRFQALDFAIRSKGDDTPANVVKRADAYLTFLNSGVAAAAIVAPTPTASPLADPDGSVPARLDDPAVVAETEKAEAQVAADAKAVIERPTVTGEAASSTAGGQAETPPAAQVEKSAPAADTGSAQPSVADVNAAVLAFNRANGREKTLALLGKFGGTKVPEIDVAKHAALLAELKAGV